MNIWNRTSSDIILFVLAVVLPWWASSFLAVYLFFLIDYYYEIIFLGLIFDILYGTDRPIIFITAVLLYIVLSYSKKYLRSHG